MDNSHFIKSKSTHHYYKERDDIHKEYYIKHQGKYLSLNRDSCTNIMYFSNLTTKEIEMFSDLMIRLYDAKGISIDNCKLDFITTCTPIDRAHLFTLSLFHGKIDYYYYESSLNIFGYESYDNGNLIIDNKSDSEKFLYDYGPELGLLGEIMEQVDIVTKLMKLNDNLNKIDEIDDLGELEDNNGVQLRDSMYNDSWFFNSDGLKNYLGG